MSSNSFTIRPIKEEKIVPHVKPENNLTRINKNIEFSSDFIIGYPGESNQDFENTLELVNKINFINSYSFVFSPRPGTVAENLDLIKNEISNKRLSIIQNILFQNQINRNKSFKNKIVNVLVENQMKDKTKLFGRTEFMTPVIFDGEAKNIGNIIQVKINDSNQNSLFGKTIEKQNKKVA